MNKGPELNINSLRKLQQKRENLRKERAFSYGEEIHSVMVSPVFARERGEKIKPVVREMARLEISCVVIVDQKRHPVGILTERDIMKKIVADDLIDPENTPLATVMTPAPVSLGPRDHIFKAMSVMATLNIKHLPIVEEGRLVGLITMRQLLKLTYPEPMMLLTRISEASSPEMLKKVRIRIPELAQRKMDMRIRAYDIVAMISLLNQEIQRKAFELTLMEVGPSPLPCCLFLTGSHGRTENLLATDQDHGLIIADHEDVHQFDSYFVDLTQTFSEMLDEIGFPFCPGYVMSMNPIWRKSLSEWKLQMQHWFGKQIRNLTRYVTLLYDAVPVYGDFDLFENLNQFAFSLLSRHHEVLRLLHEEEEQHHAPLGLLGRFITEKRGPHKGELNVKKSGLIFFVECARILALLYGIRETATLKRVRALVAAGHIHPEDGEYFDLGFRFLLHFALRAQIGKIARGEEPNTFIDPKKMTKRNKAMLKHAFKALTAMQDLIATEFGELVI